MEYVYCIYIENNKRKYLYDIGEDKIDIERTAKIMTATDPVFRYHTCMIPYNHYLRMVQLARADRITVSSLIESYLNE